MAVLLTGDMNDEVDAATTLILNCPPGSEIDTDGFDIPDDGDGDRTWNLAPLKPSASPGYRGRPELIDHIFVSHYLVTETHTTGVTTVAAAPGMPSRTTQTRARASPAPTTRPTPACSSAGGRRSSSLPE